MTHITVQPYAKYRLPKMVLKTLAMLFVIQSNSAYSKVETHAPNRTTYHAPYTQELPKIDGVADESVWQLAKWQNLDHRWLGPEYSKADFQGRYKVVWNESKLYLLAEIVDDILIDSHQNPLIQYWDDDTLEIFLDEDFSGGEHQYNHNAFAYHMALDNQAIDIGTNKLAQNYSHHVQSRWLQQSDKLIWELSIDIYQDTYKDVPQNNDQAKNHINKAIELYAGKVMGLMVAYCDNDGSELRENFIGSESAPGKEPDRGWKDAGLFGKLVLVKE